MEGIEHTIEFMCGKLSIGKDGFISEYERTTTLNQRILETMDEFIDKSRCPDSFFWAVSCRDEIHRKAQDEHDQEHVRKVGYVI